MGRSGSPAFPPMTTESPPQYDETPDRIEGIPTLWARRTPDAPVIVDDRVRTWVELEAAVEAAAAQLRSLGVVPGDRVMVVGENGPAAVQMLFAAAKAGAWVVNVNARLSAREIDAIRRHCTPRTVAFLL